MDKDTSFITKLTIGAISLVIVLAFLSHLKKAEANDFISNVTVGGSINPETKDAVAELSFKALNLVDVNVDTNETATLGVSLTRLLRLGPKNVNVYFERTHDLRGHLWRDANNVIGVVIGLEPPNLKPVQAPPNE